MDLPECPFCGAVDECPHLLLEWWITPAEVVRGSMTDLVARLDSVSKRLLEACCRAKEPPRHAGLMDAYSDGVAVLEEQAVEDGDLADMLDFHPAEFAVTRIGVVPGVSRVEVESPRVAGIGGDCYVSLWARDPAAVRMSLLDTLAPLEVQLDQLNFARLEREAKG